MAVSPELLQLYRRGTAFVLGLYWLVLFVSTHIPLPQGALPGNTDKAAHFIAYGILAVLVGLFLLARSAPSGKLWGLTFLIPSLFAIIDELLQIPVGRHCDIRDMLADWIGSALGTGVLWVICSRGMSKPDKPDHSPEGAS